MGGLFGGLLGLFNFIGGGVLYALIGTEAWRDGEKARWARVLLGGVVLGLMAGLISFCVYYRATGWARIASKLLGNFAGSTEKDGKNA